MEQKLQYWYIENMPDDKMIWKESYKEQILFIRDKICSMLANSQEDCDKLRNNLFVISEHVSKSIKLPVFRMWWKDTMFIMRNNFFDWKVSVEYFGRSSMDVDFLGIFDGSEKIKPIYCEGFKDEWVYNSFDNNKNRFTVEIKSHYDLYVFFLIIKNKVFDTV